MHWSVCCPPSSSVTRATTATAFATTERSEHRIPHLTAIEPQDANQAYKRRNLTERCVNRLKQFRRIATRYEKTARAYLSMLCIASTMLWVKTVNAANSALR
jgi:transposase